MRPDRQIKALRRRADRLAHTAETFGDREIYRNVAYDRERLREAAGQADQRARVVEEAAGYRFTWRR